MIEPGYVSLIAGALGTGVGALITRLTSDRGKEATRQLTTESGSNGDATIRKTVQETHDLVIRLDEKLDGVVERVIALERRKKPR